MFERFTEAGRAIVVLGHGEARQLGHDAVYSDHLLLGVLLQADDPRWAEEGSKASEALFSLGVSVDSLRQAIASQHEAVDEPPAMLPLSDDAKAALEAVLRLALSRNLASIGPPEYLLGMLDNPDLEAVKVLRALGIPPEAVSRRLAG